MVVLRILVFAVGFAGAALTFSSAVRTVVVPRAEILLLQRIVFLAIRRILNVPLRSATSWEARDRILAHYAPAGLMTLAVSWILLTTVMFALMFWGLGTETWRDAFRISGSSVTTLGFASTGTDWPGSTLSVIESVVGLILIALLISFLPTMYGLFSSREQTVTFMTVRAGTPPSGVELLERLHRIGDPDDLADIWSHFETWFNELGETHTSFMALPFFRSPNPARSWVTTGGAVLDGAALRMSAVDRPDDPRCALALRAGYSALRDIAEAFQIEVPEDPQPDDPISVSREEFDEAVARLETAGLPMIADREQAWRDFQGWRVNYDSSLVLLANFVSAPYAPWSSDRSIRLRRLSVGSLALRKGRRI